MLFLPSDVTGLGLSPKAGGHSPLVISEAPSLALLHTSMPSLTHTLISTHTYTTYSHTHILTDMPEHTTSHTYAFSPAIPYTNPLALLSPSTHTTQPHTHTHLPTDLHSHMCTLITAHSHIHVLTDGHLRIMRTTHSL